jgi:hypothetical protein
VRDPSQTVGVTLREASQDMMRTKGAERVDIFQGQEELHAACVVREVVLCVLCVVSCVAHCVNVIVPCV